MYILLNGRVNKAILPQNEQRLIPFLQHQINEMLLFASYSSFDIQKGQKFQVIFDRYYPSGAVEFSDCTLKRVTQQMFAEWDQIPKGWKTLSLFEFENEIPKMIEKLPEIDSWSKGDNQILISTREFWEAYSQGLKQL